LKKYKHIHQTNKGGVKLDNENKKEIILSEEMQKSILKFFMKTSIPRKARQERMKKSLSENERQRAE